MIQPAFEILNQRGTPMFFSDVLANRPTAGIVGRIFIATDSPYGIFRDTGSGWDQIAGSGGGGISGSGAAGQVTFWTGASAVSGSNNLFFDNASGKFLVGTNNTAGAAKLQVTSSTGDDHIRVFGTTSPSIRIDNAVTGPTQRFVMGLATATNNFIQGSAAGDICISTASANPLLFGMWQTSNASEVMRISTSNNLLIGGTTDSGERLQITGNAKVTGNFSAGASSGLTYNDTTGVLTLSKNQNAETALEIKNSTSGTTANPIINFFNNIGKGASISKWSSGATAYKILEAGGFNFFSSNSGNVNFLNDFTTGGFRWAAGQSSTAHMSLFSTGNFIIGGTTDAGYKLDVQGTVRSQGNLYFGSAGAYLLGDANNIRIYDKNNSIIFQAYPSGVFNNEVYIQSGVGKINITSLNAGVYISDTGTSNTNQDSFIVKRGFFGNVGTTTKNVLKVQSQYYSNLTSATIVRGIYVDIDDTTTFTGFSDVRAFESLKGGGYFNTSSVAASAILQADSTTKGFLPPRMTTTQINAIASPAEGLVVYNTTLSHLCCYQAGAWVKFSHTPM